MLGVPSWALLGAGAGAAGAAVAWARAGSWAGWVEAISVQWSRDLGSRIGAEEYLLRRS